MVAALGSLIGPAAAISEVRGHQGNPWNELADRLAKFALHHQTFHGSFPTKAIKYLASNKFGREWLWWGQSNDLHKAAFPPDNGKGQWTLSPCDRQVECAPIDMSQLTR